MIINIQIGDWSGDGHGKCEDVFFESNLPTKEVREAYFAAMKKCPHLSPESFCHDCLDFEIPKKLIRDAKKAGYKIEPDGFGPEGMAAYTAWFCTLGNPKLVLTPMPEAERPTLAFYGNDKKDRHIGFIGYGLFSV